MQRIAIVGALTLVLAMPVVAAPDLTLSTTSGNHSATLLGGEVATFTGTLMLDAGEGEAAADLLVVHDRSGDNVAWDTKMTLQRDGTTQVFGPGHVEDGATFDDIFEGKYAYRLDVQVPEVIGSFDAALIVTATSIDGRQDKAVTHIDMSFTVRDAPDSDTDGLSDAREAAIGTDPDKRDTDGDNLSDCQEVKHTVYTECWEKDRTEFDGGFGTDPLKADTDGDGLPDDREAYGKTDPLNPDTDGDGLTDGEETPPQYDTDPLNPDTDGDGLNDGDEIEWGSSPHRPDTDDDGIDDGDEVRGTFNAAWGNESTDPTKTDSDGDGLDDYEEMLEYGTDPNAADSDGDGMDDKEEVSRGRTDPVLADTDGDGLNDREELLELRTDPRDPDTDGDGLTDAEEVNTYGTDPKSTDTDGDGLSDYEEIMEWGTDPFVRDSDDDGLDDGEEVHDFGTDPAYFDTDLDGLSDGEEKRYGTLPTVADFDEDFLNDGDEIVAGTDPLEPDTDGDGYLDGDETRYDGDPLDAAVTPPDLDDDLIPDVRDTDADGDGVDDMASWKEDATMLASGARVDTGGVRAKAAPAPAHFTASGEADGYQLWRLDGANWSVVAEGPEADLTDPRASQGAEYRLTPYWIIGAKEAGRGTSSNDLPGFEELPTIVAIFTDVRREGDNLILSNGGDDADFTFDIDGKERSIFVPARSQQSISVTDLAPSAQSIVWLDEGERVELGAIGNGSAGKEDAPTITVALLAIALLLAARRRHD